MKLLFAPDSFKGSLSAIEICKILENVAKKYFIDADIVSIPVADGGEGTVEALLHSMGGEIIKSKVTGPLFETVVAEWGMLNDGNTAIMEMAQASGLPYVPEAKRDPRYTTSFGTGEMIAAILKRGIKNLIIGIGGSATNDGGMGMLSALGAVFTDNQGNILKPVGAMLSKVKKVDFSGLLMELKNANIRVICDVNNPLLGEDGASFIYGPQKGATKEICEELERGMANYADVVGKSLCRDIANFPGAGAAGGLGAALCGVLSAHMSSGIDAVLDAVDFNEKLSGVSLVITGEGRIDGQSINFGKVPVGVAKRCALKNIPVVAIVGGIGEGAEAFFDICQSTIHTIVPAPISLEKAMQNAAEYYTSATDRVFRAISIGMNINKL